MDPSWTEEVEVADVPIMDFADPRSISSCAVKLTFFKENENKVKENKVGSGFFINIPNTGNQYVIFTAAHNLASRDGTRTTDLVVVYSDLDAKIQKHPVQDPADVYVSQDYLLKGTPDTDYGFIRMPSDPSVPRRGFRFSLKLAYEDHFTGRANVIGFQDKSQDGQPVQSSGVFLGCYSKLVEYSTTTQGGISGSAVYTEYKRAPVVVAIHNTGSTKSSGSRGARLSPEVYINAFKWLGPNVIQENVQLAGNNPSKFFLSFQGTLGFARARLNSGTKFNIMPAEMIQDDRYALRIAGDNQWVMFSTVKNEVVKTVDMKDKCLFFKDNSKKKGMRIVIKGDADVKDSDLQLRIEGKYLKTYDEDAESSEISFVKYGSENDKTYTMFRLA